MLRTREEGMMTLFFTARFFLVFALSVIVADNNIIMCYCTATISSRAIYYGIYGPLGVFQIHRSRDLSSSRTLATSINHLFPTESTLQAVLQYFELYNFEVQVGAKKETAVLQ